MKVFAMSQSSAASHDVLTLPPKPGPAAPPSAPSRHGVAVWAWLRTAIPTAAVIGALVALAAWGYSTDWKLPSFSSLVAEDAPEVADWCQEHNVPDSQCIECNASLVPPDQD